MPGASPTAGWVAPELAAELPGLGVRYVALEGRPVRTPKPIKERLRTMANRINGGSALHAREDPVPAAYRVFWRRVGLDPDVDRTPVEQLLLERLHHGGLASRGMPRDATRIATLETGVPVLALDTGKLSGRVGVRLARAGERVGDERLSTGQIVYCDERAPVATLAGEVDPAAAVGKQTTQMTFAALAISGVSEMSIEDALWIAEDLLGAAGSVVGVD